MPNPITPLRPSITVAPGALDNIPLAAFMDVIHAFGLRLGSDMVIRREAEPDIEAIERMREAVRVLYSLN